MCMRMSGMSDSLQVTLREAIEMNRADAIAGGEHLLPGIGRIAREKPRVRMALRAHPACEKDIGRGEHHGAEGEDGKSDRGAVGGLEPVGIAVGSDQAESGGVDKTHGDIG